MIARLPKYIFIYIDNSKVKYNFDSVILQLAIELSKKMMQYYINIMAPVVL